jgi:hypothetical protein
MFFKHCRTIRGICRAIKERKQAVLEVWDIMPNPYDSNGAYLNLGEGRYAYVGSANWMMIRNYAVSPDGIQFRSIPKYRVFFGGLVKAC